MTQAVHIITLIYFKIEICDVIITKHISKCSQLSRAGSIMRHATQIMRIEKNTSLRACIVVQASRLPKFYMTRLCLLLK
jgi:hypothetical protein